MVSSLASLPNAVRLTGKDADWRARMHADAFTADEDKAHAKLGAYWSRIGFKPIAGTKLFGLNLALRRPTLQEVVLDS